MFKHIDNTPLTAQELAKQCFTLISFLLSLEDPVLRESFIFIAVEKQSPLLSLLTGRDSGVILHPCVILAKAGTQGFN